MTLGSGRTAGLRETGETVALALCSGPLSPRGHGWRAFNDRSRPLAEFDVSKPNVARVYDAMLGGKDNFAADRAFVDEAMRIAPKAPPAATANRAFLRRVVRYLTREAAIIQFLDLVPGCPRRAT